MLPVICASDSFVNHILGSLKSNMLSDGYVRTLVAVKLLKQGSSNIEEESFKNEIELMIAADLRHPNVVRLLGVSIEMSPMMIVLEYMNHGLLFFFPPRALRDEHVHLVRVFSGRRARFYSSLRLGIFRPGVPRCM